MPSIPPILTSRAVSSVEIRLGARDTYTCAVPTRQARGATKVGSEATAVVIESAGILARQER